ncbi:unnamed protein product [Hymenolepis diminuta]|uniref:RRM domain-containing protein n=1 Tax=Hymenolepis diminuta TaxID=6216 RepID=A0A0R3SCB0_HYMDI|nr:unnamed protein product [Hymenolepis diminuta]
MNEKAKVFVKYLPKYVTELGLSKMAENFGETISVRISRRLDGVSNGYGYVQFAKIESADEFIKGVNGQEIGGLFLLAEPFKPKEIKRNSTYSCFVENLSPIVSGEQITKLFSSYGKVNSTHVLRNTEGKCLSLTCVNFDSASNTTSTLSDLNNVSVDGSCLYVDQNLPKEEKQHRLDQLNLPVFPTRVIVRNLGSSVTSTKLASVFSNYGTVKNIEMLKVLGLAKVEFSSHAEAHRALRLNGTPLGETEMVVTSESDEIVSSTSSLLTSPDPNETSNQNSKSETFPRFERFTSFKSSPKSYQEALAKQPPPSSQQAPEQV